MERYAKFLADSRPSKCYKGQPHEFKDWEKFRTEAFEFAVEKGYDHPAFTDWSWPDASDADQAISATQATAGDNE